MNPLPHQYDITLRSESGPYATARLLGVRDLRCAPPVEFGGPGDAWSPEHLLLAAVQSCYLFTLRAIARASNVDLVECEIETAGTVDRCDGVTRFVQITLRPIVTVASGTDELRIRWLLDKAQKACLVSASLATPVRLEAGVAFKGRASLEPATVGG